MYLVNGISGSSSPEKLRSFPSDINPKRSLLNCMSCEGVNQISKDLSLCYSKRCENVLDSCFTHVVDGTVRRGCLKDSIQTFYLEKGIDLIGDCMDKTKCELCSGNDNCNNNDIMQETCIDCDIKSNVNCSIAPDDSMIKECKLVTQPMGCYIQKTAINNFKRGCISDLNESEAKNCIEHGPTCKSCDGDNCNLNITFQSCHICNSSYDGGKCAISEELETKFCKNFLAECFIFVENDTVSRGCFAEDLPEEECFLDNCKLCQHSTDCNNKKIENEVCIGYDSRTDKVYEEVCPLSIEPEGCYHVIDKADGHKKKGTN